MLVDRDGSTTVVTRTSWWPQEDLHVAHGSATAPSREAGPSGEVPAPPPRSRVLRTCAGGWSSIGTWPTAGSPDRSPRRCRTERSTHDGPGHIAAAAAPPRPLPGGAVSSRSRVRDRERAVEPLRQQVPACPHCRPDTEPGVPG
ncbi:DUF6233 domain-containing protein [Streptomyces sp. NPDC050743]|uniref:DUF6233 domain-containing protein n=1 Tax=Streptomyces sp. NPDC050743 TaxID=3365634 RepID=UPI0037AD131E